MASLPSLFDGEGLLNTLRDVRSFRQLSQQEKQANYKMKNLATCLQRVATSNSRFRRMASTVRCADFRPWEKGAADRQEYCKQLAGGPALATWGMLYCCGYKPVEQALQEISERCQLALHAESFKW